MNQPLGYTHQPQPKKRPGWVVGGATVVSFVALLYLIELFDQLSGHTLDRNGIQPLETDGLKGIIFAPLLHADWQHLIANTVPALVLGFLVSLAGMARFVWATAIIWILGGIGTWLHTYQEYYQWDKFAAVLCCILVLVLILDFAGERIRKQFAVG